MDDRIYKYTREELQELTDSVYQQGKEAGFRLGKLEQVGIEIDREIALLKEYLKPECNDPNCARKAEPDSEWCVEHSPLLPPKIEKTPEKIGNIRI